MFFKQIKQKKCRICKKYFQPKNSLQVVCSMGCAIIHAENTKKKRERCELKEGRERLKTYTEWQDEAKAQVQRYARLRDEIRGYGCISCGTLTPRNGRFEGGHYRNSKMYSAIRFNTFNIHRQCHYCNHHLSGNLLEYKRNLTQRLGVDKVEWLEAQTQVRKYTIEELKRIKRIFTKRANKLAKKLGA